MLPSVRLLALLFCLALAGLASCADAGAGGVQREAALQHKKKHNKQTAEEELTCQDVLNLRPDADVCAFVRAHCESQSLINYPNIYYCHVQRHGVLLRGIMVVLCTCLLVLLFRIIARAADDYFSCILSQISQDLGLPPRLGGVTLLALGNGAPDLSSCIAAVKTGNYRLAMGALTGAGMFVGGVVAGRIVTLNGGARARGAQIRDIASQFIAMAVVTGIVASGWFTYAGVATLLSIYGAYVVVVAVADFSKRLGVEWTEVARRVSRRMSGRWGREMEMEAPMLAGDHAATAATGEGGGAASGLLSRQLSGIREQEPESPMDAAARPASPVSQEARHKVATSVSRPASPAPAGAAATLVPVAAAPGGPPPSCGRAGSLPLPLLSTAGDAASLAGGHIGSLPDFLTSQQREEQQQQQQRQLWQQRLPRHAPPVAAFQPRTLAYGDLVQMTAKEYRQRALAEMAQSKSFYRRGRTDGSDGEDEAEHSGDEEELEEWEEGEAAAAPRQQNGQEPAWQDEEQGGGSNSGSSGYRPPVVSFDASILARRQEVADAAALAEAGAEGGAATELPHTQHAQHPGVRRFEHTSSGGSRTSAGASQFSIASMEMASAGAGSGGGGGAAGIGTSGIGNSSSSGRDGFEPQAVPHMLHQAADAVQWPLVLLLQATVPLVEVNSYQREWFLRSLAASPFFIVAYLQLFSWQALLVAVCTGAVLAVLGYVGTQHLQGKAPLWTLGTGYPIGAALVAVYGFAVAAMWISLFASEIVGLLEFFGMLSKADPAILGVTVLAWGNSLMDYMNNTAMAGKSRGGNSMAMTACFAGPLFNMLVGLGLGFWALLQETHMARAAVQLDPVVLAGCAFIMLNCASLVAVALLHRQFLPAWWGWAMVGCYGTYLATVLVLLLVGGAD